MDSFHHTDRHAPDTDHQYDAVDHHRNGYQYPHLHADNHIYFHGDVHAYRVPAASHVYIYKHAYSYTVGYLYFHEHQYTDSHIHSYRDASANHHSIPICHTHHYSHPII